MASSSPTGRPRRSPSDAPGVRSSGPIPSRRRCARPQRSRIGATPAGAAPSTGAVIPRSSESSTASSSPSSRTATCRRSPAASASASRWRRRCSRTRRCCFSTSRRRISTSPTNASCVDLLLAHAEREGAVVASLHDLDLAWDLASHAVLIDGSGGVLAGSRDDVLVADRLSARYSASPSMRSRWPARVASSSAEPDRARRRMSCPASRPSGRSCESTSREALRLASPSRWSLPRSASVALAFVAALAGADANALTVVDDAGHAFVFERPPQRIVTLAPSLTELVFAAGGGASLVAHVRAERLSRGGANRLRESATPGRLDVERVIALKPDLVLVWQRGNTSRELEQLEAAGIRLFHLEPRRLADVARAIERLGTLLGHEAEATPARERDARCARAPACRARRRSAGARFSIRSGRQPLMTINGKPADRRHHHPLRRPQRVRRARRRWCRSSRPKPSSAPIPKRC